MSKDRHHDNDPEDETFVDYSEQELRDIFAYIATIPFILKRVISQHQRHLKHLLSLKRQHLLLNNR